jgi:hypothetical protein
MRYNKVVPAVFNTARVSGVGAGEFAQHAAGWRRERAGASTPASAAVGLEST